MAEKPRSVHGAAEAAPKSKSMHRSKSVHTAAPGRQTQTAGRLRSLFAAPPTKGDDREITAAIKRAFGVRVKKSVYLDVDPGQMSEKTARSDEWIPMVEKVGPDRGSAGHVLWFIVVLIITCVALGCLGAGLWTNLIERQRLIYAEEMCFYAPYASTECDGKCTGNATAAGRGAGHINLVYRLHSTDAARSFCECRLFRTTIDPKIVDTKHSVYNVPCTVDCSGATP